MKTNQLKNPLIFLFISILFIIPLLGITGCGENENKQTTDSITEPVKQETQTPPVVADSQNTLPANQTNQQAVKSDAPKEITPADKKKEIEMVKKSTAQQPVITNTTVPQNKPVTPTNPTPVVKPTEPVKPIQEPQPKPVEVPKPVPVVVAQPDPGSWIVPAKYKTMTSPTVADKESIALGKSLYGLHCKSCHGSKGEGDGSKAATLDTKIRSFLNSGFQSQTAGEVYYKSMIGRIDMPKFEKKIADEEERWAIVHYIMNLKN